uniref:Uncharacterized protein n=1 Tax=Leviviridae sp. TaxID=2027243 RepID=A0A514D574_9VIRU|nr:MAG: hypothetical protein H1Rhizo25414_000004 [Leviviridae sp.]
MLDPNTVPQTREVIITLHRKTRSLPDLRDQIGKGQLTIWVQPKPSGAPSSLQKKTHAAYDEYPGTPRGYQVTDSEIHSAWTHSKGPTPDEELKNLYETAYTGVQATFGKGTPKSAPAYDAGGDFFSQKTTVLAENPSEQFISGRAFGSPSFDWCAEYRGPILATPLFGLTAPPEPSDNLDALGATAIARCSPTNNIASAANFLAELRADGLPKLFGASILKERLRFHKSLGEEYLNEEFGWKPLIGDLRSIASAVTHSHKVLSQYERDSGKVVRRRYEFPEETSQSTTFVRNQSASLGTWTGLFNPVYPGGDPLEILYYGGSTGSLYRTRQTWKKVWFSGAFTYHLPSLYNSRIKMVEDARHASTLLGLDLTPEVLWNATPWTWAIGWFSNAGDVVANLSDWATDGLVLKYGYIMMHSIVTDTYFVTNRGRLSSPAAQPSKVVISVETKRRKKATPFGFGLTMGQFTPRQLAITAALGLTKGVKRL